jgi:UDP:flavonoid glycosyltransferase YjiC (YdhE family)
MDGHDAVQLTLAVAAAHRVCRLLAPRTLNCLAAGVPQVITPQGADQFVNAARVAELGLGQVVPNEAEPGTVGAAVERLLSDQDLLSQVQAVRDEIARMPHPSQVVQVLEARH